MSYSLPRELHPHVGVVVPTTYFGTVRSMRSTHFIQSNPKPVPAHSIAPEVDIVGAIPPKSCNTKITPSCLRTLYNTASYVVAGGSNNTMGVTGYLQEYANKADLQVSYCAWNVWKFYQATFRHSSAASVLTLWARPSPSFKYMEVSTIKTTLVLRYHFDQKSSGLFLILISKANLDIQYTTGINFPVPAVFWRFVRNPKSASEMKTHIPTLQHRRISSFHSRLLHPNEHKRTLPRLAQLRPCSAYDPPSHHDFLRRR